MSKKLKTGKVGIHGIVFRFYIVQKCQECNHEFEVSPAQLMADKHSCVAYIDCPECNNEHSVYRN